MATIRDAAQKLTGAKRRAFQARVVLDYLNGSARRAETVFGWSRRTLILGLHELRTGITCVDNTSARGNRTTEEKLPQLAEDMRALAEPARQVDPTFQSPFCSTRMTAKAMRQALIDKKSWQDGQLPCANTIGNILNPTLSRCKKRKNLLPSAEYSAGLLHAIQGRYTDGISPCRTFGSLGVACFYHQRLRPYWHD